MSRWKLCKLCGCPMKPKGVKKRPDEFDHACGCRYHRHTQYCPKNYKPGGDGR